jgi:hypothetical protein
MNLGARDIEFTNWGVVDLELISWGAIGLGFMDLRDLFAINWQ